MTNHFVNLVSWRYFAFSIKQHRRIHVDSLTLKMMFKLFGKNAKRSSGVAYFTSTTFPQNTIFLTSSAYNKSIYSYILPFWKKIDDIVLTDELVTAIEGFNTIVIGISSPKQDYLADLIMEKYPNREIFCLGAAIYEDKSLSRIDTMGLTWFTMMIKNPKRFAIKIGLTCRSIVKIVISKKEKRLFMNFIESSC